MQISDVYIYIYIYLYIFLYIYIYIYIYIPEKCATEAKIVVMKRGWIRGDVVLRRGGAEGFGEEVRRKTLRQSTRETINMILKQNG